MSNRRAWKGLVGQVYVRGLRGAQRWRVGKLNVSRCSQLIFKLVLILAKTHIVESYLLRTLSGKVRAVDVLGVFRRPSFLDRGVPSLVRLIPTRFAADAIQPLPSPGAEGDEVGV